MYCVKCGVKLQDGVNECPLCRTPVWNPDQAKEQPAYPDQYPRAHRESNLPAAVALTVLCVTAVIVILTVCLKLYGSLNWGGYAISGVAMFYVIFALPNWFRHPMWEVFIPVDHAAAALFVLYVCLETGGSWFLSFALPVILISCLLSTALYCLLKYVRGGRLFILGGLLLGIGGFTVLIELFEHLTFGVDMFRWSLYSLPVFAVAGIFLLLAGMIPGLRHALEKRTFF